jgi:hypothetical protein
MSTTKEDGNVEGAESEAASATPDCAWWKFFLFQNDSKKSPVEKRWKKNENICEMLLTLLAKKDKRFFTITFPMRLKKDGLRDWKIRAERTTHQGKGGVIAWNARPSSTKKLNLQAIEPAWSVLKI